MKLKKKRLSPNASTQWTETLTSPGRIPRMISYHSWTLLCSWRWMETSTQTSTCSLTATTYMGWACNPYEGAWTKRGCTHSMKALKHVVILTRPSLNWWRWQGKNLRNQGRRNRMTDGTTSDQVTSTSKGGHLHLLWISYQPPKIQSWHPFSGCDISHLNPGLFSHLSSCDNSHD